MDTTVDITQVIIDTINTIFGNLFNSIDNNLYSILDKIAFLDSSILNDSYFENLLGTSSSNGILLIANSLLIGFILYYSIRYFLSHLINTKSENPSSFIFKLILYGIFMNFSFFLLEYVLNMFSYITLSITDLGQTLYGKEVSFSELISIINSEISVSDSSMDIFSLDGLIKGSISISLLNLVFSYSIRYILVKVFILLSPFAIISLTLDTTSWFFKSWFKNLFSLLFLQILIALILLVLFSIDYTSTDLFTKILYVGGLYALIKANSIVRDFIGGISTEISQNVNNFMKFKN